MPQWQTATRRRGPARQVQPPRDVGPQGGGGTGGGNVAGGRGGGDRRVLRHGVSGRGGGRG
eukprot:797836-Prymnesium_polylepis.2